MKRPRLPSPGDRVIFTSLPGLSWSERGVVTRVSDTYVSFRSDLDDVEVMVAREWVRVEEAAAR